MKQSNNQSKRDNTPTNTLRDGLLAHSKSVYIPNDTKDYTGVEATFDVLELEEYVAQAVNKAEITMWEKTTKAMMDILQENFQYRLMCGEVRDPDGKIDVMQGFVKYQELEPERKKFSEYLEGLKLELNRDEAPNQEKQNES